MSYAAQCLICRHARRGGKHVPAPTSLDGLQSLPMPSGCERLTANRDEALGNSPVAMHLAAQGEILNALLYQLAGEKRCVGFEKLTVEPDTYWAEDLPDPKVK